MLRFFFKPKDSTDNYIISTITTAFHIRPKKLDFYRVALTHSSATKKELAISESNERLEYLGDAILGSVVAHHIYNLFPEGDEGFLTKTRSKIVSREHLSFLGEKLNLRSALIHNLDPKRKRTSIVGNAFEAIIGAIYLDHGYAKTQKALITFLDKYVDYQDLIKSHNDYKSLVYEYCQKNRKKIDFVVVTEEERGHDIIYTMDAVVDEKTIARGKGTSKKRAQQDASLHVCEYFSILPK